MTNSETTTGHAIINSSKAIIAGDADSSAPAIAAPDQDAQLIIENPSTSSQPFNPSEPPQPLSKRAQKRAAKAAYLQEKKLERRQRERAARKEKKRERRERIARGEIDPDEDGEEDGQPVRKKARKGNTGDRGVDVKPFRARVAVDLGFDSYMTEKEIVSLSSQLAYCYSANRKSSHPFETLLFTSLNGRLREKLERENNAGYKRWTGCEWWEEGYEQLWSGDPDAPVQNSSTTEEEPSHGGNERSRSSKDAVVYLTADTDEELEGLMEGETYILGGIVDRNRHKNLCQKKAASQGIRTASLPIGKYLKELKTRKVLTVNQVFEILVHWVESRNWEEAMYSVMPKRKFAQQPSAKSQETEKAEGENVIGVEGDGLNEEEDEEDENEARSDTMSSTVLVN